MAMFSLGRYRGSFPDQFYLSNSRSTTGLIHSLLF
uniref:Uncharacterized protein n=1 Tax=Arundo donax TaxID=35708 RepID=A0A0A9EN47_ARUDO